MRKLFRKLHKWLAIPTGIIITITCLTGALLVFQDETLELINPSHYFVDEVKSEPIALNKLIPFVNNQLDDNSVTSVKIASDKQRTYTMGLAKGFRESVFVDPYTGKITGYYKFNESAFFTIMKIHRWLMDGSRTVGKYTVGISTLIFSIILITGFVLWFPRQLKKNHFRVQTGKGRQRLFYDLHNVLGAYACLILLICALTGLMWSFEWYRNGVFKIFGAETEEQQERGGHGGREKKEQPEMNVSQWPIVIGNLSAKNPNNEYIRIEDGKAVIHQKDMITSRAADEYKFNSKSGEILQTIPYESQPTTSKIWGWAYSLHVGNYWGIWSKILTFIGSLIGASLPITGYYLTFVKHKKKKKRKQQVAA